MDIRDPGLTPRFNPIPGSDFGLGSFPILCLGYEMESGLHLGAEILVTIYEYDNES